MKFLKNKLAILIEFSKDLKKKFNAYESKAKSEDVSRRVENIIRLSLDKRVLLNKFNTN